MVVESEDQGLGGAAVQMEPGIYVLFEGYVMK